MSLIERLHSSFSDDAFERGWALFEADAVESVALGDSSVEAEVVGTKGSRYEVGLFWSEQKRAKAIQATCTCPQARRSACQHICAVLVWLDEVSEIKVGPPGFSELQLTLVPPRPFVLIADDRPPPSHWRTALEALKPRLASALSPTGIRQRSLFEREAPTFERQFYFLISRQVSKDGSLTINFFACDQDPRGSAPLLKQVEISRALIRGIDPDQAQTLRLLLDFWAFHPSRHNFSSESARHAGVAIPEAFLGLILPRLCATGRFGWLLDTGSRSVPASFQAISWDDGPPWRFGLQAGPGAFGMRLEGRLERGDISRPLKEAILLFREGTVLFDDSAARLEARDDFAWISMLRAEGEGLEIPEAEIPEALETLGRIVEPERLKKARDLGLPTELASFTPILTIWPTPGALLEGAIAFEYGGEKINVGDDRLFVRVGPEKSVLRRDRYFESQRVAELSAAGAVRTPQGVLVEATALRPVVEKLNATGWQVLAEGRPVRTAGVFRMSVESGVDWFDLAGAMSFGEVEADLPALLAAARQRRTFVQLGDGTVGLLPEEWLTKFTPFAELSVAETSGKLRFAANQALVLDALLASEPAARIDEVFVKVRERLRSFERLTPQAPAAHFQGELRPYQELGLAWLCLLADLKLGGCLADDMGLGKTVQVLALLQLRHFQSQGHGRPSLLVVPKSVVHHWAAEAERFTPELKVLVLHGSDRHAKKTEIEEHQIVITTYGTLLRDVEDLHEIDFDVVVLDEAQTIKNPLTNSAKAARLLRGELRLALSGTPVENHLGDLWSIFEFLNPGLLGRLPAIAEHAGKLQLPPEALATVAAALKPLILRRTKTQVLKDLPEKTEATLFCELSVKERKRYDQLRKHYRTALLSKVETVGLARSKVFVLEALLRLRQAACHGGLIDEAKAWDSSSKLDLLYEQLEEVIAEGHKVLVFSQFVKLLTIVRHRLDNDGVIYEYLDGRTQDRQRRVERFQTDPECSVFLISLKAGGVGLNLTAASYVFLLDPWWNPAVEMQAIDRAHRIGQKRSVFAYRLIAKDTVEEKIVALQAGKRDLADAIIGGDGRVLKQLTVEDLELLLG